MEKLLMTFSFDANGDFQLFGTAEDGYFISSDVVHVSTWGGGCFWCAEFEKLSDATSAINQIVENYEKNGKVDTDWLVKTFGKGTC